MGRAGALQSLGLQRARHDLATKQQQGLLYLITKANTFFFSGFWKHRFTHKQYNQKICGGLQCFR